MDFHSLKRRDLQALCKKNKIPANITNVAMADALAALDIVSICLSIPLKCIPNIFLKFTYPNFLEIYVSLKMNPRDPPPKFQVLLEFW